jgi:2-oxoglutarate ferredoxin oxidoreductase subunit beta
MITPPKSGFGEHVKPTFDNLTPEYGFQWCPGCGNFGILNTIKFAVIEQQIDPSKMVVVSDIGQAGKLPMWLNVYGFHGLHGRALPLAQGVKIANPELEVLVVAGDGGAFGEGMAHFVSAARRNMDLTYMVHDNAVYALTTGQASQTTLKGTQTKSTPEGNLERDLNPLQVAIASGATFVARAFAGDQEHFQKIFIAAMKHKGFAFIDVLQPCVVWNKVQTWQSWNERVVRLKDDGHDLRNRKEAFALAEMDWNKKIPTGIFYQSEIPTFEAEMGKLMKLPLVNRDLTNINIDPLIAEIMGKEQPDLGD